MTRRRAMAPPVAALLMGLLLAPVPAAARESSATISPARLVAEGTRFDGQTVAVEGEAIGEALRSGAGHVWVNLLGEGVALGVWTPRDAADGIGAFGHWGQTGDTVRAVGEFHVSCERHGGETDLHARTFEVVRDGAPRSHPVAWWRLGAGAAGLALAVAIAAVLRMRTAKLP